MRHPVENLGVGVGFRRDFAAELLQQKPSEIDWLEIHPENFVDRGGPLVKSFEQAASLYPVRPHGLTVSFGNTDPLPWNYLKNLKAFLKQHRMTWYSDHLCFSSHNGKYLHDLLPIPMTLATAKHVSERVRIVQDFLEVPVGIENTSYYVHVVPPEMSEIDFVSEILDRSQAYLMCDVNNLYVNQLNHGSDATEFLQKVDVSRILQIHVAGHLRRDVDLVIDTHGESVCDAVLDLLKILGQRMPLLNVLLERDDNIPSLAELLKELQKIRKIFRESHLERASVA